MIQRIQTIWLLLAAAASLAALKLPFFSGVKENNLFEKLTGSSYFLLLILSVAVALIALAAVFLFKNRKLQSRFGLAGLLLQLVTIAVYYQQSQTFTQGNYSLTAVLTLLVPVFFILALLGIRKDERLIKSMDRLR
nr:DUF4293 family protein [uncultured Lacibacter sp.]